MAESYVEVFASGGSAHVGPDAVERFRLISLRSALKLEKVGLKLSRGVSALKIAKVATGLKTNDRDAHIARLSEMVAELEKSIAVRVQS